MKEVLKKLGLNNTEIKLYLTLLPLNYSPSSNLAQRTGLNRATAGQACQKLVKKGFITAMQKGNAFIYSVEPPDKLMFMLDEKSREIEEQKDSVGRILGNLEALMNPETILPKVKFYKGMEGIKRSYSDILNHCNRKENINSIFCSAETVCEELHDYFLNTYLPARIQKGIKSRNLALKCNTSLDYKKNHEKYLSEIKIIQKEDIPLNNSEVNIFGEFVHCMSFDENGAFAIILEDKHLSYILGTVFEAFWNKC